jgi:hypothetical protein
MGKNLVIGLGMVFALLFAGLCAAQGMGDRKGYDWMGTPVVSDGSQKETVPDYLNPYSEGRPEWDPFGAEGYGSFSLSLQIQPANPVQEGLTVRDALRLHNQLYLQQGSELLTGGEVPLGEPYALYALVAGRGSLHLYDSGRLVMSQGYVTPGWYRITGAYANHPGASLYSFISAAGSSNNVTLIADSRGYSTSFSLTGRVVDQSGLGMPGVMVTASNSEGGRFTTTTGASGYYGLNVATGIYLVNAKMPGYDFTPSTAQVQTGVVSAAMTIVGRPASGSPPSPWA